MTRPASNPVTAPALLGVVGTMSVIMPAFLTGAMAVQVKAGLAMSESDFGLAVGAFFVGSSLGSAALGRLAERLGPRLAIRLGLTGTILAELAIAGVVDDARALQLVLVVAGLANALTQPAINLLLVTSIDARNLGFVMSLKQSGMPSAALLGGAAVPLVALTLGWRAAYLMAVALTALAMSLTMRLTTGDGSSARRAAAAVDPDTDRPDRSPAPSGRRSIESSGRSPGRPSGEAWPSRPDLGLGMLLLMAAVGVLGGGAANVLVGYLVSGAVDGGIAPGPAGLLLTFGAALGVASRLIHGWLIDHRSIDAMTRVIAMFVVGAGGALALALHRPLTYLIATPLAFAAGWAWPGLFNLVVVRANQSAPASATGVTQTGVYVGSLIGPVVAGVLIERSGYATVWLLTAAALCGAALFAAAVRAGLARTPDPGRRAKVRLPSSSG